MSILIIGLVLFVGMHLIPRVRPLRTALVDGLGANRYRAIYSIISAVSLVLIVWGFARAPIEPVFQPPSWGRTATMTVLPVVFILFAAANMPTHIRAFVRHPMLIGLLLWGVAHLAANGDLRSVWLFGLLAAYAAVALIAVLLQELGMEPVEKPKPRALMDVIAVAAGLAVTGVLAYFHGALFGMPIV